MGLGVGASQPHAWALGRCAAAPLSCAVWGFPEPAGGGACGGPAPPVMPGTARHPGPRRGRKGDGRIPRKFMLAKPRLTNSHNHVQSSLHYHHHYTIVTALLPQHRHYRTVITAHDIVYSHRYKHRYQKSGCGCHRSTRWANSVPVLPL